MFKLDLEKAEEPEIKLPTSLDHRKSKRVPEKHLLLHYCLCQSHWLWGITTNCGKFWKRWEWPASCLLRNLYADQKTTVRTGHGTTGWFQIGQELRQGCILSPCLFDLNAEYIMRNAGLDDAQAGIKIARRNINNLRYAMTPSLWQKEKN